MVSTQNIAQVKDLNNTRIVIRIGLLIVPLLLLVAACGDDGGSAAEPSSATVEAPSLSESPGAPPPVTAGVQTADEPIMPNVVPPSDTIEIPDSIQADLAIIWEAWKYLGQDYVDREKLDPEAFSEQAIRGMLRVLEDPQTAYVSPEVMSGSFGDTFEGKFEGIGAHVSMNRAGRVVILSPIPGSPAEAAGIKPGDIILEVDGESLEGLSLLEAVSKIRGPGGSIVILLVKHLIAVDPVEISIERGVIPLTSVMLRSQPEDKFAHVRITNFYPRTAEELVDIVQGAVDNGAKGLVLDLRDNPGGPLDSVVEVASQFLAEGMILYDVDGNGRRREWMARKGGRITDLPMVVLVNQNSASSSEVLAGALQDHERAILIGSSTFGKGSVNILRPLSNGGGLYITVGRWYTPLGRLIDKDGLDPDIEVEARDPRDADVAQLRRALEELEQIVGTAEGAKS